MFAFFLFLIALLCPFGSAMKYSEDLQTYPYTLYRYYIFDYLSGGTASLNTTLKSLPCGNGTVYNLICTDSQVDSLISISGPEVICNTDVSTVCTHYVPMTSSCSSDSTYFSNMFTIPTSEYYSFIILQCSKSSELHLQIETQNPNGEQLPANLITMKKLPKTFGYIYVGILCSFAGIFLLWAGWRSFKPLHFMLMLMTILIFVDCFVENRFWDTVSKNGVVTLSLASTTVTAAAFSLAVNIFVFSLIARGYQIYRSSLEFVEGRNMFILTVIFLIFWGIYGVFGGLLLFFPVVASCLFLVRSLYTSTAQSIYLLNVFKSYADMVIQRFRNGGSTSEAAETPAAESTESTLDGYVQAGYYPTMVDMSSVRASDSSSSRVDDQGDSRAASSEAIESRLAQVSESDAIRDGGLTERQIHLLKIYRWLVIIYMTVLVFVPLWSSFSVTAAPEFIAQQVITMIILLYLMIAFKPCRNPEDSNLFRPEGYLVGPITEPLLDADLLQPHLHGETSYLHSSTYTGSLNDYNGNNDTASQPVEPIEIETAQDQFVVRNFGATADVYESVKQGNMLYAEREK